MVPINYAVTDCEIRLFSIFPAFLLLGKVAKSNEILLKRVSVI